MQFGTNYNDTLNLLYLKLLRFSDKFVQESGVVILTFKCARISVPTILWKLEESR